MITKRSGFSVLEVLIAGGIIMIIGFFAIQLVVNASKAQRGLQAKDSLRDLTVDIRSVLSNPTACINTFNGKNLSSGTTTITTVKDAVGGDKFVADILYMGGLLKFKSIVMTEFIADTGYPNSGRVKLYIYADKTGEASGVQTVYHILSAHVDMNASKDILKCIAVGGLADSLWQLAPSDLNNIYFSTGNIGIGTNAPSASLEILGGNLKLHPTVTGSAGNGAIVFTDTTGNSISRIYPDVGNNLNIGIAGLPSAVSLQTNGNVGIGNSPAAKLDVAGEIKIQSSGTACSAVNEGSLRYNSVSKRMEFCNGTSWLPLGSSPVCHTVHDYGGAPNYWSYAQCAATEYVLTGGGECSTNVTAAPLTPTTLPRFGFLHSSGVFNNGWVADCYLNDGTGDAPSHAWALCCNK